jgi:signal transduction histidine kinase
LASERKHGLYAEGAKALLTDNAGRRLAKRWLTSTRMSRQSIVRAPIDLKRSLISMIQGLAPIAAVKNIDLWFEGATGLMVTADEMLLRLLIGNYIIESAVTHTPDNGEVDVTLRSNAQTAVCVVCDSRPGISEEERDHAFQRFYGVGTPLARGTENKLTVLAETAARLSGKISLKAPEGGQGLLIKIALPRAHALEGT